jgi:hypothetical protein
MTLTTLLLVDLSVCAQPESALASTWAHTA